MKNEALRVKRVGMRYVVAPLLAFSFMYAQSIDEDLAGFDDAPVQQETQSQTQTDNLMSGFDDVPSSSSASADTQSVDAAMEGFEETSVPDTKAKEPLVSGLSGELSQMASYSWHNDAPHEGFNAFKSKLFLDYEHSFENGMKFKINANAYYDAIYRLKGKEEYSKEELDALESEAELFDAYLEGKISEKFDFKLGRQVVVWGRSDTIRVTDILNPLDNRTPGMVDIEDLRLPVTMAKFDYFAGDWRITPMAILEQRFSKNPPFGGDFYPVSFPRPDGAEYDDVTYALSVGGEFEGWDINFYTANTRDDAGYMDASSGVPVWVHDKVQMYGTALNILSGSWLFKAELAHFDGLKYTSAQDRDFSRTDLLLGVEYNGIADTMISYDIVGRHIHDYDNRLLAEMNPLKTDTYQHAFRISSEFYNATLKANYLLSLFGASGDEGGFQRAWITYDLADGIALEAGIVDYIGGSALFDAVKDNDRLFAKLSYSF